MKNVLDNPFFFILSKGIPPTSKELSPKISLVLILIKSSYTSLLNPAFVTFQTSTTSWRVF